MARRPLTEIETPAPAGASQSLRSVVGSRTIAVLRRRPRRSAGAASLHARRRTADVGSAGTTPAAARRSTPTRDARRRPHGQGLQSDGDAASSRDASPRSHSWRRVEPYVSDADGGRLLVARRPTAGSSPSATPSSTRRGRRLAVTAPTSISLARSGEAIRSRPTASAVGGGRSVTGRHSRGQHPSLRRARRRSLDVEPNGRSRTVARASGAATCRRTRSSSARRRAAHESDSAGGYHAVSAGGTYRGAYQFLRSTWNNVAASCGPRRPRRCRPRGGGARRPGPARVDLFHARAAAPWGGRCAGSVRRDVPVASDVHDRTEPVAPDLAIGSFTDHGPVGRRPRRDDVARRRRPPARAGARAGPGAGWRPATCRRSAGSARVVGRVGVALGVLGGRRRAARPPSSRRDLVAAGCASRSAHLGPDLHQARPDHLGRRRACSRPSSSPSSSCCATACRPSRSTTCAGSSSSISAARSTTCSSVRARRRSRPRRSRRCTRRALRTGEEVVVKVQRPQVARLVREDIQAMAWLAPRLVGRIPVAALANPPALVELFAETIVEELDFRLEAAEHARHRAGARGDRASARRSCPARTRRS